MIIKSIALATALAALTATSGIAATVTLNVVGGQLLGASNVDVNGTLYDVEFVDGTCIALFDGCDKASDFAFSTLAQARAASESLGSSVFLDGPLGDFDSRPGLTAGIGFVDQAFVFTPYEINSADDEVEVYAFLNRSAAFPSPDGLGGVFSEPRLRGSVSGDDYVYARFTATPISPVPLPAGGFMLLAGLAGLGALRRRKPRMAR